MKPLAILARRTCRSKEWAVNPCDTIEATKAYYDANPQMLPQCSCCSPIIACEDGYARTLNGEVVGSCKTWSAMTEDGGFWSFAGGWMSVPNASVRISSIGEIS